MNYIWVNEWEETGNWLALKILCSRKPLGAGKRCSYLINCVQVEKQTKGHETTTLVLYATMLSRTVHHVSLLCSHISCFICHFYPSLMDHIAGFKRGALVLQLVWRFFLVCSCWWCIVVMIKKGIVIVSYREYNAVKTWHLEAVTIFWVKYGPKI